MVCGKILVVVGWEIVCLVNRASLVNCMWDEEGG